MTAIVSRAGSLDIRADMADPAGFELANMLSRIQKQMLSLLGQFQLCDSLLSAIEMATSSGKVLGQDRQTFQLGENLEIMIIIESAKNKKWVVRPQKISENYQGPIGIFP